MRPFSFFRVVCAAVLFLGLVPLQAISQTTSPRLQREEIVRRQAWHIDMTKVPLPKKGCFQAAYPNKQWQEVACKPAKPFPQPPRLGPRPLIVGNGDDVSAKAPSGFISTAIGSFDSSTATSETGTLGGGGPQVANVYTLQLNTDTFSTTACSGAANPAVCQGWEQFIFENDGTSGGAFIQYWLLFYDTTCPSGWNTFTSGGHTYCWRNDSLGVAPAANQPITNLPQMSLTGTVSATADSVSFFDGTTVSATAGDNSVNAAAGWTTAEFNVVGDCCSSQANFNAGAVVVPRTRIFYGGTAAPICVAVGFTGETNNLSFGPTAPATSPPGPAVFFTESSAGGAGSECAAATTVGDTHLTTFRNLFYDFQAAGDFLVAQEDRDFVVQARQVSGAPTWPNATVNKAIATRMGKTSVALCLAPERLLVDGKIAQFGDKNVLSLPGGVDITRRNNEYFITSQSGDSVHATVHPSPGWIDVAVGLGHWPATVSGILAHAGANVNEIAARDGARFAPPFAFDDLYRHYAESWRIAPADSLLSVCGAERERRTPSTTFYPGDLDPQLAQRTRAVCVNAGVKPGALLDACTVDVAMLGNEEAARVFVTMPPPAAVGTIVAGGTTGAAAAMRHPRFSPWLLLLLLLFVVAVIAWIVVKKR